MMSDRPSLLDRLAEFVTRHRIAVFLVILGVTACFMYGASRIQGRVILQEMFPYDHPYLKLHAKFSKIFGSGASTVVICVKAKRGDIFNEAFLTKIKAMTREIEYWDEVYRRLTVSIGSRSTKVVKVRGKGEIAIETLMLEVPKTEDEIARLKEDIFSTPAYNGIMVSRDGTAALIYTEFKENISYERVHQMLRKLIKDHSDMNTSIHTVGFPVLMGWIYSLKPQLYLVFAISLVGMIVVLYLIFFGNILGMIVVMVNALILAVWGLGFIGFTGINFSPLLYVLAFLVGARMIGNSHQITYRYFEELHSCDNNRDKACYETMRTMITPNFAAVTTDAAGFLVLIITKIALMHHLALIMTFWMLTIILTAFLVPTICTLIPLKVASERWAKDSCQVDWQARFMMRITRASIGSGRYITSALIIGAMIFCGWQMSKLKIGDPTPGSPLLWPNHPFNQDQALVDRLFDASSENFLLYYEGISESVYDPRVLNTFEAFDRHMEESLPDIYKSSSSLNNFLKMVNETLHDGDVVWRQLPRNENLLVSLIGYVKKNTSREVTYSFIDFPLEHAQITLYFADHTSDNLKRIRQAAYDFFKERSMKNEKGEFKLAGGRVGLEMALNEEMKRAHAIIDATVLIAIFLLCTFCFMSITAGLMLTFPLILANSVAGAYMALSNMGLSINTLPVAAIGVGVGVDFAIYLYSRCQEEFPLQGGDWNRTITQAICTCGKAVVYTGITVILPIITWYFFSDMRFQAQVGFFLAMIIGTNVILTLTLHPLMIYIIKPKFISNIKVQAKNELRAVEMEEHIALNELKSSEDKMKIQKDGPGKAKEVK
jgi:predicted RND superfamily exporter protein